MDKREFTDAEVARAAGHLYDAEARMLEVRCFDIALRALEAGMPVPEVENAQAIADLVLSWMNDPRCTWTEGAARVLARSILARFTVTAKGPGDE